MAMMKNNQARVTNFSLQQHEDEVRDQMESGTTKEYGLRDLYSNDTPMEPKNSGYGRYYNLSTRRGMFMVLGITLGTIVFFFNLQRESYSYIIVNQNLTIKEDFRLHKKQPFPIEKRGGAFITTHSGCRIAKWIYDAVDRQTSSECRSDIRQLTHKNIPLIEDYDTIYVPFNKQDEFVDMVLDYLDVQVVLISGQWQNSQGASDDAIQRILSSSYVVHWFCQNLKKYAGHNPHHEKISPFPYGLKEFGHKGPEGFSAYKRIFFEQSLNITASDKDTNILVGYISKAEPSRRHTLVGLKYLRKDSASAIYLFPGW